ncbi:hypothetical protein [Streptomyces sp. C184]|uniref:hypothetical protein n=1 Tax=Streptomyces sp. C184 TaxID=3237121 RepID=UPI0034C5C91A
MLFSGAPFRAASTGTSWSCAVPMPVHGHARPEPIAPLLAWLTSPENTHVTDQVVFVDGGADAVPRGADVW